MLGDLRDEFSADFVVVNGENAAGGIGITAKHADELFAAGADVITLGNHTYRHRDVWPYLEQRRDIIRRHARVEVTGHGAVAAYIHTGGKVGVLVEVGAKKDETTTTEAFKQLVRDITLQIAAANPISVDRTAVPAAVVEREREVCRGQVPPGKPANIVEKIVDGKMDKFYSGVCLVDQAFIKNPDQTISQLVAEKSKELGDNLVIRRFLRYSVGEQVGA